MTTAADIANALERAKRTAGGSFVACCPAHDDSSPSLSIADGEGGPIVHCHAGCSQGEVLDALAARGIELRRKVNGNGVHHEPIDTGPFNVAALAHAKLLKASSIGSWGVVNTEGGVGFEYRAVDGTLLGTKVRRALSGNRGFFWTKGSKPALYGLWRIEEMRALDGRVILCEGETDALTLWQHDFCALGLPGASMWKEEWLAQLPEGAPVYIIVEPDQGGQTLLAAVLKSELRHRARIVHMSKQHKDPSALYLSDPETFAERFESLLAAAVPAVEPKKLRIQLRQAADIVANPIPASWLLRPYLEHMVLALMYGELGTLKSFVTLDMMLSIAAGRSWGGSKYEVKSQPVVYVSAEGKGLAKRLQAWSTHHCIDLAKVPFYAIEHALDLSSPAGIDELVEAIKALGIAPSVIAIDTLSRNAGPLDENDTGDMATFINALDAKLRQPLKCSVLLVHHVGHGDKTRARGSYTLMSNTDANYFLERPDTSELTIKLTTGRLKDSDSPAPLYLKARIVELGTKDSDGVPETSLVLLTTDERPMSIKKMPSGKNQLVLLELLEEDYLKGKTLWTAGEIQKLARDDLRMHKSSAKSAQIGLVKSGFLKGLIGGRMELVDPPTRESLGTSSGPKMEPTE